ncbi:MAG: hypothetical protein AAF193_00050 [Bacteroidota bacterium]
MGRVILLFSLFLVGFQGLAQRGNDGGPDKEKIKQLMVAFYTDELDLSVSEAEQFWPLFNAHFDEVEKLKRENKKLTREMKSKDKISDSELLSFLTTIERNEARITQSRFEFIRAAKNLLGPDRTFLLTILDSKFKKELLRGMRDRR